MSKETISLKCRHCGAPISGTDVVAALSAASCAQCGAVSGVKGLTDWSRDDALPPKGYRLEADGKTIVVFYDGGGFRPGLLMLFAFAGSGTLLIFGGLFRHIARQLSPMDIVGVCAAPLLGMTYALLDAVGLLHRVRVRANRDAVVVSRGVVPSWSETSMSAAMITQVFTRESRSSEGGRRYEVVARGKDGAFTVLVGNLYDPAGAIFFEQKIEKALGLKDIPVPGEIPRSKRPSS